MYYELCTMNYVLCTMYYVRIRIITGQVSTVMLCTLGLLLFTGTNFSGF